VIPGILNLLFKFDPDLFWSRVCSSVYKGLSQKERETKMNMKNKKDSEIYGCCIGEGILFPSVPLLSLPFHKKKVYLGVGL